MAEMSLYEQAKSVLQTFRETLKNKNVLADEQTIQERMKICEGCHYLKRKRGAFACAKCGCNYKRKVAFSGSSCPIGEW